MQKLVVPSKGLPSASMPGPLACPGSGFPKQFNCACLNAKLRGPVPKWQEAFKAMSDPKQGGPQGKMGTCLALAFLRSHKINTKHKTCSANLAASFVDKGSNGQMLPEAKKVQQVPMPFSCD